MAKPSATWGAAVAKGLGTLVLTGHLAVPSTAAQEMHAFTDWLVGCDNIRTCTAFGFEDGNSLPNESYVRLERAGQLNAEPKISVVLDVDGPAKPDTELQLAFDDRAGPRVPHRPLQAEAGGDYVFATLHGPDARTFIGALHKAKRLTLTALEKRQSGASRKTGSAVVSLSGAVAALTFMDDRQKRAGTDAALIAAGDKPATSMPPVPKKTLVNAMKMVAVADPLPPLPTEVAKVLRARQNGNDDYVPCDGPGPMAVRLSDSATVWGVCASMGAYNLDYAFYVVENGKARPAHFEVPPGLANDETQTDHNILTNPGVSDDGLTISSFYKGVGFGDCGSSGEWAWDGSRFRLVSYRQMDLCRGVFADDWPTLYRADRQ